MKTTKEICKTGAVKILKTISVKAAKFACNTASLNLCGQPKAPKEINSYFKKNN